jgi:hypothetical protein
VAAAKSRSTPTESAAPPVSAPPVAETVPSAALAADPRNLLFKIAAAVGRESLESLMQDWEGAELNGNVVVLRPGTASDFAQRQIQESLAAITQAASRVLGSKVKVILAEPETRVNAQTPATPNSRPAEGNLLETAKREPIVKSFLEVFPGPVKAEKIDK